MAKLKVNITLDEELIGRVDDYAEDNYMNRSSVISLACTQYLATFELSRAMMTLSLAMKKIADTGEFDEESRRQLEDFQRLASVFYQK